MSRQPSPIGAARTTAPPPGFPGAPRGTLRATPWTSEALPATPLARPGAPNHPFDRFWCHFGRQNDTQIAPKAVQNQSKIASNFQSASGSDFGSPRAPSKVLEDRPFHARAPPRSISEAKMEQKWRQKSTQNPIENEVEIRTLQREQNGAKTEAKWSPNGTRGGPEDLPGRPRALPGHPRALPGRPRALPGCPRALPGGPRGHPRAPPSPKITKNHEKSRKFMQKSPNNTKQL